MPIASGSGGYKDCSITGKNPRTHLHIISISTSWLCLFIVLSLELLMAGVLLQIMS